MKMTRLLVLCFGCGTAAAFAQANAAPTTDIGTKLNDSLSACPGRCTIKVPAGTYSYTTDIVLEKPETLECDSATVLDYKGTGNAVKLGRDGVTYSSYSPDPYEIRGCTFTGGANMVHGIYVNQFVVKSVISSNYFHNFGNAKAFNIWYQGQNWDSRVLNNYMWADSNRALTFNGIAQNAADPANPKAGDSGQSQLFLLNNHIQSVAPHRDGIGVYLNGLNGQLIDNVVSGFAPNIQLGAWSNGSQIKNITMERSTAGSAPCISFGDSVGPRVGYYVDGVTISDSTCNVHNTDFGTEAHFLAPASEKAGMQNCRLINNVIISSMPDEPIVVMNDLASQTGNYAALNRIGRSVPYGSPAGRLHNSASHISEWSGTDEVAKKESGK